MSPGAAVDKLWHYMLLNTAVSSKVYDLLGGVVEHCGIDHTDLPDDTKLLQRVYSLNFMRLEGAEPDVQLWVEPGTIMHSILQSVEPVPQLQDLPGGGLLYVTPTRTDITPTFTEQLRGQLEQALVDLTARSCCGALLAVAPGAQPDAGTAGIQQQDITVSPVVNNEFPSDVVISLTQPDGQPGGFHIIVRTLTGKTLTVRVYPWMKMKQVIMLFAAYSSPDMTPCSIRFQYEGRQFVCGQETGEATVAEAGLQEGSNIAVTLRLGGC